MLKKILIYNSGGGLGDSIQLFPLLLSLQNYYKDAHFFYLGAHSNHFKGKLKEFNINIETLDLGLKYFGFRWWHLLLTRKKFLEKKIDKIDLIIDLQSKVRNSLILKRIPHNHFYTTTLKGRLSSKNIRFNSKQHLENLNLFLNKEIKTVDYKLSQLPQDILNEAEKLLPVQNYIGLSLTQGNEYRKKSWSIDNFIILSNKIIKKNKIPVFFIEKKQTEIINKIKNQVPGALFPELDSNLSCPALVTALSSKLELAVSIDNGVMHMIGLSNIPMIVLFGPTSSEKFAPKNNLIKILDSKKIYKTNNINSITVDDVYSLI